MLSGISGIPATGGSGRGHVEQKTGRRSGTPAIEWPTVVLIVACYAAWAGAAFFLWPSYPVVALIVLGVVLAMQSSLMHEAAHGHPTRKALDQRVSGRPADRPRLSVPAVQGAASAAPCRRAADRSVRRSRKATIARCGTMRSFRRSLKAVLTFNNTMVGRFVIGPPLATAGFLMTEAQADRRRRPRGAQGLGAARRRPRRSCCRSSPSASASRSGSMCWCRSGSARR